MIDSKTVHEVLRPYLFEPNTKALRAEMVAALEDMGPNIVAEDRTTGTMIVHGACCFRVTDGLKSYEVTYGPGYPHFQTEEIR